MQKSASEDGAGFLGEIGRVEFVMVAQIFCWAKF